MSSRQPPASRHRRPGRSPSAPQAKLRNVETRRENGRSAEARTHRTETSQPTGWLYGRHVVLAAIANPRRRIHRLIAIAGQQDELAHAVARMPDRTLPVEVLDRPSFEAILPAGAIHQGFAAMVAPLDQPDLEEFLDAIETQSSTVVVILDQAADPRNVGAILRSAAAFGTAAVIVQDRHAPQATAALAKAASGALEFVPLIRVTNIARTLRRLSEAGFFNLGFDADAPRDLAACPIDRRVAVVLGAEETGLRRLVREACDDLVRIPMTPAMESLNVSATAAIALYHFRCLDRSDSSESKPT